ncbi:DEAD/DEAH box helicase [Roseibium sp. RKSG952]|uniref:SNF2-related protein n=1 Tax=Roseibium sp. RKSG952 TaxID=2529384 RepID=UPI0018AD17E0|nr:DEAD/DEAH box helicase [Roseibium sp. RKSG952]
MKAIKTYGDLTFDQESNSWIVTEFPPHVSMRIKDIFRRVSKFETSVFKFPNNPLHCFELDWFMDRFPFRMSATDERRLKKGCRDYLKEAREIEEIFLPDYAPKEIQGLREGCELWKHQSQFVQVFERVKKMLLGDDVGLGKTNSSIGAMLLPGTLPAAVVLQAHLPDQWVERIEEFSHLRVHVIKTRKAYKLPEADVYIFSYSKILGWTDLFATEFFKMAVYDEPQELRAGTSTEKGMAARILSDNVEYILGLTATPIMNYGIEMHHVIEFIVPGLLGTKDEFVREWCHGNEKLVSDPDALGAYLIDANAMLRRTDEDIGRDRPLPNVMKHHVPYDSNAAKSSDQLAVMLAQQGTSGSFVERGRALRRLDALVRQKTGMAKAVGVANYVRILLDANLPLLLAGWHREVYDVWLDELRNYNPVMYTGTEGRAAKRRSKEAFLAGDSNCMIISLRSGAGLDGLQYRSQDIVFGELDWSPMIHKQLAGRLDRYGQEDVVNSHFLIADGGSDPLIVEALGIKSSQSHGIMNPDKPLPLKTSNFERMQMLAKTVLERRGISTADFDVSVAT